MSNSSSIPIKKLIPKILEEDLKNIPKFRQPQAQRTVASMLNDSLETAMYDEILGPLIHPKSKNNPLIRTAERSFQQNNPSQNEKENEKSRENNFD